MTTATKSITEKTKSSRRNNAFYSDDDSGLGTEDSIGYLIKLVHKQLVRNIDNELEAYDLTAMQWVPLQIISRGQGNTVASCARQAEMDTGAMTRMLDRLEAKGLINRKRSEDDRRVVHIELTRKGRNTVKHIPPAISRVLNQHLSGFSKAEFAQFKDMLRRLLLNGEALQK